MTGQDLKNSILQLAIQGKLVPQDANDEPASVLLERIKKEKARLVKEKKIKKEKPLPEITDEEKPFDIPESWEWVRLGDLFLHTSGKQQSSSNKGGGKPQKFITTSNLYWGRFELDVVKSMNFTDEEIKNCSATKGDLLVCEGGAGYGRSAIWPYDYDICLQNHVHRLRPVIPGSCEYVYYFIYLLKETNQLQSVGTAMPGLSANRLKGLVLPLPPLAEQKRIVAKIEELIPLVEEYGKAQEELDALNAALPERLKQSILQEAIQGKLGTNNPDDEPASELLARIRKEKAQLIKEKKIKKEKPLPEITDEEKPFEIPENWEWVRLGDIIQFINGDRGSNYPSKDKLLTEGEIPFISAINIGNRTVKKDNLLYVKREQYDKLGSGKLVLGDIVLCIRGSLGKVCIYPFEIGAIASSLVIMREYITLDSLYVLQYIESSLFADEIGKYNNGTAQPNLGARDVMKFIFPLPPLAEQHRIVEKLDALLPKISELNKRN